jgi:hypothetical protein
MSKKIIIQHSLSSLTPAFFAPICALLMALSGPDAYALTSADCARGNGTLVNEEEPHFCFCPPHGRVYFEGCPSQKSGDVPVSGSNPILPPSSSAVGAKTLKDSTQIEIFGQNTNLKIIPKLAMRSSQPKLACYRFNRHALELLRAEYHQTVMPSFQLDFLNLADSNIDLAHLKAHPDSMAWSKEGDFLFQINPGHHSLTPSSFAVCIENKPIATLKNEPFGLSLVGWYWDAKMMRSSRLFREYFSGEAHVRHSPENRIPSTGPAFSSAPASIAFSEVEKNGQPYLVSILDLTAAEVPYLKKIRQVINAKLESTYQVDRRIDQVHQYIHFPYAIFTVGFHVHTRINQYMPAFESSRSFELSGLIDTLENGGNVIDLLLRRQAENHDCIYQESAGAFSIMKKVPGVEIYWVDNPFRS